MLSLQLLSARGEEQLRRGSAPLSSSMPGFGLLPFVDL
jgi:hypothetical protein